MSHLHDDDDDDLHGHSQRELTLSTSTILFIFIGLALSWALFFGFGYNMGSKGRQAAPANAADNSDPTGSSTNFNSFKPSPASPAGSLQSPTASAPVNSGTGPITTFAPAPTSRATTSPSSVATSAAAEAAEDAPPPPRPLPGAPARITLPPSSSIPQATNAAAGTGSFVVQVAAVSHQEDADLLVGALRGKGYSVTAHTEPDRLVHIQVGPFNNRKDADAMRQRLLSDGYNAIVK